MSETKWVRKSLAVLLVMLGSGIIGTALTGGWWLYVVTRPGEHQGAGFVLVPALLVGFGAGCLFGVIIGLARAVVRQRRRNMTG